MKIGVAGLGRMGAAIARRLIDVGHEVHVWNRTAERAAPLAAAGAAVAASPRELAAAVEAVITIVTDAEAIEAVYGGPDGLLAGNVAGRLFIEMSTVRPEAETALAERVKSAGAVLVECPVGGTVGPALQGKLLGLAGGEAADVERARPVLDQLCRRVDHVGPIGAGASMKLAINLPLAVFWQAFGEAYALCDHLKVDRGWLVELFADTSGGPNVLKARGAAVAKALATAESGSATFDCDSIRKDLRTMVAEAHGRGFALPVAERTLAVYDEASQAGWGGRDCTELPAYWAGRKG
ncbi:3-hydroxyisobutyrate dehydrogenase [Stella humosa]|uniref:3-hydroxyisobutyrate dehydrogenase n=1 Tax=Stella humosa TaxID=94 RepID=A0A3N1M8Q6_9PROT|nr:NAD(P)-dependent oxidoreductase [Stella humosa]ROP99598.1 3-hydroxyisobutyrate dehydrogenase [Stella humosa]BBK31177.1 3-hydroxyisobutyrate dehydrogenase [Stella humosa]